jgi:uncharacterized protein YggE
MNRFRCDAGEFTVMEGRGNMRGKTIQFVGGLCMAAVVVLALAAWTEGPSGSEGSRLITVTGDAEVRVVPDEVILTLGVQTWDKNLDAAKRQNDEIVRRVLALADEYGIAPEHVQTDYVSIEPRYRNGYYEASDFIGYFVSKTIVITLRDLDKFEDLLASTLEAGVNYVHGVEFRTTELRKHRDEARALAVQAAREKAEAMSGELDQKVGEPLQITEVQTGWWSGYNAWWGSRWGSGMAQNVIQEAGTAGMSAEGSLAPGQINVNARVSVTFEITK